MYTYIAKECSGVLDEALFKKIDDMLEEFPNFEEDMIIWHMFQLDKNDETKVRVPHMHILLRRKEGKRISKNENSKIFVRK